MRFTNRNLINVKLYLNLGFRNPTISILIGKIQTKKLSKDMKKYELVLMSLKG